MTKDLFIIDTGCNLNNSIAEAFNKAGYEAIVATDFEEHPDDVLRQAAGFKALCIFVNRKVTDNQVSILKENGNKWILCCSAGFDNVPNHDKLKEIGMRVARVPSYSPSSIAEYAISSIMALSKNIQRSFEMTKLGDFRIGALQCVLLEDKTVGVIGTGLIGKKAVEKLSGLVKKVLCFDAYPANDWIATVSNAEYVPLPELLQNSNIISIHVPLLKETHHLINADTIEKMKDNVIIVNTSRGEIIDTPSLVEGLKSKKILGAALDVFEGEKGFMFKDMSKRGFENHPELEALASLDNVIISSHIAFYTDESIRQITQKTFENFKGFEGEGDLDPKAVVL